MKKQVKATVQTACSFDLFVNRLKSATHTSRIALFVRSNGNYFCFFADTIRGREIIETPYLGTKLVGVFENGDCPHEIKCMAKEVKGSFK